VVQQLATTIVETILLMLCLGYWIWYKQKSRWTI